MGETVKLWTIQHFSAWQKLEKTGKLTAGIKHVSPDRRPAYQWMSAQMEERTPNYPAAYSAKYPLWAWVKPKPNLRHGGHLEAGTRGVRIAFESHPDDILQSGFMAWHSVLNDSYCSMAEAEAEWFSCREDRAAKDPSSEPHVDADKRASWKRIFDLSLLGEHEDWCGTVSLVQATLGQLTLDQVTHVDFFTGR